MNCRLPIADPPCARTVAAGCRLPEFKGRRQFLSIANRKSQIVNGFTLVEMLVVLAIMAILAALTVPALKNFGGSDAMTAADQQMQAAVARARQLAMSQRTTVYMVFVPTNFWTLPCNYGGNNYPNLSDGVNAMPDPGRQTTMTALINLAGYQLTGYNFVSLSAVGDQPGQHAPHYLARWQSLPDGTFIMQQKFSPRNQYFYVSAWDKEYHDAPPASPVPIYGFNTTNSAALSVGIPFPTEDGPRVLLPYIAFNYQGQLTANGADAAAAHEYIPLVRGSVSPAINPDIRTYRLDSPQVIEKPAGNSTNTYNIIDIGPLTGRATLETPKVQ